MPDATIPPFSDVDRLEIERGISRILRQRQIAPLTPEERALLLSSAIELRNVPPRTLIVRREMPLRESTLLLSGFVVRANDDLRGGRQVLAVHVPGDFPDLHAYPLKYLDHDLRTVSAVRLAVFPHAALDEINRSHPGLAQKLWFSTMLDASMHRKWVFRLGKLSAIARIAHFFCETAARLTAAGLRDGDSYHLPFAQFDLADICGLTSVHVNRVIRDLRERELCTFRSSRLVIRDAAGLARLAEFSPSYLYLTLPGLAIGERPEEAGNQALPQR